jgi:5'-3' exoribonuclease 1
MFKVYKSVLPKAGGYINEFGVINLKRLAILLDGLSDVEYRFFESDNADAKWFKGKQMAKVDVMDKSKKKGQLVMTTPQNDIFKQVKQYVNSRSMKMSAVRGSLDLPSTLKAADRKFVEELAEDLGLEWQTIMDEDGNKHLRLDIPGKLQGDNEEDEEDEDEEAQTALFRVIKRYEGAKIVDATPEEAQEAMNKKYDEQFQRWKNKYYKEKFGWGIENDHEMKNLTENYVQGLQWVLFYYYRGIASWPWFYGFHYSPMISGRSPISARIFFDSLLMGARCKERS